MKKKLITEVLFTVAFIVITVIIIIIIVISIRSNYLHLNDDLHSNVIYGWHAIHAVAVLAAWEYKQRILKILNFSSTGHYDNVPISHWFHVALFCTRVSDHYFDGWKIINAQYHTNGSSSYLVIHVQPTGVARQVQTSYCYYYYCYCKKKISVISLNTSTLRHSGGIQLSP